MENLRTERAAENRNYEIVDVATAARNRKLKITPETLGVVGDFALIRFPGSPVVSPRATAVMV